MLTTFQPSDLDSFASIPAKWRNEADLWTRALRELQEKRITKHELCKSLDVSISTLNRKITAVKEGGWRGLVPNYKGPSSLPPVFIDYWKTLQESYQRKTRPAYRELLRRWMNREDIPGYTGHPGWPNLPRGWDERTLYNYQPTKMELTALRKGLGEAIAMHGPKTLSTRVGLWHLSHIIYDDVKLDVKAHLLDSNKPFCALQIGALDLLSASRFTYGMKPQLIRADGTKTGLTEAEMRFAFCSQLYNHGLSKRGSTIVIEHGTATLRPAVMDICKRYLGDKISFSLSGMTGKMQAIAGMGDGKGGGGNFRHKAALESLHNLMHNELSALPGQTGHDRDEPEFLGVAQREHEQLYRIIKTLPPEYQRKAKSPFLEYHTELVPVVAAILDGVNKRTDHSLEGYQELGFFSRDYRILPDSAEWVPESRLLTFPQTAQSAYLAMAQADPRCMNVRMLSPHEVFTMGAGSGEVYQPPLAMIAEILYQDLAVPRKCRSCNFTFKDATLAPGHLSYEGRITRPDGREEELRDEVYDTVVNPFDLSVMWVFSAVRAKGTFLGTAKRDLRACRADAEATQRKWGNTEKRLADQLGDTRRRNTHRTNEAIARRTHNTSVITAARQAQADFTARATDALDASLPNDGFALPTSSPANNSHENISDIY